MVKSALRWAVVLLAVVASIEVRESVRQGGVLHGVIPRNSDLYTLLLLITVSELTLGRAERETSFVIVGLTLGWLASWTIRDSGLGWIYIVLGGVLAFVASWLTERFKSG